MSKKIGLVILTAGTVYLVLIAWLLSWWIVPGYREHGPGLLSRQAWYGSAVVFTLWGLSGPLGALMVAVGAALSGGVSGRRLALSAVGGMGLVAWFAFLSPTSHDPVLFGVGGGLILLCFLASCLQWVRNREALPELRKTAADLRMIGYVFFFVAAWGICGLLGAPFFALRPDLAHQFHTVSGASGMAVKVLVSLVLGGAFFALAERKRYQSPGPEA